MKGFESEKTRPDPVVTGTGAVSPLGRGAAEFYARLSSGENAIRPLPPEDRRDMQATHAARYEGFSPQPEIPPMKARRLDRGSQFALIACSQAVAEAGYAIGNDPEGIGIAMGTGSAGAGALTEFLRVLILESPEAAPPFHFPNTVANASTRRRPIASTTPNTTRKVRNPTSTGAVGRTSRPTKPSTSTGVLTAAHTRRNRERTSVRAAYGRCGWCRCASGTAGSRGPVR